MLLLVEKILQKGRPFRRISGGRSSGKVLYNVLTRNAFSDELSATFSSFGPLVVDWPNKNENNSYFPPKGIVVFY